MSQEVTNDMAKGRGDSGVKYEYRVHAIVTQDTKEGPVVEYHVGSYLRPKEMAKYGMIEILQLRSSETSREQMSSVLKDETALKNILLLDYIYTGKNIDILDFDIGMVNGLPYLQTATIANTFKEQGQALPSNVTVASTYSQSVMTPTGDIVPTPVFFGSKVSIPKFSNTNNAINTAQAAFTLTSHASTEVAGDATILIS